MCRYECGTELELRQQENKYREVSGTLHTRERCQSIKSQTLSKKVEPLTLEQLDTKLKADRVIVYRTTE